MEEFKPNSYKSKEENGKKQLNPVVSGTVGRRKKTGFQKIAAAVSDNIEKNDVKGRIVNDILLPTVLDMVNTGLSGMFGIDPGRSRRTLDSIVSTARSSSYWNAGNSKNTIVTTGRTVKTVYDFDDLIYPTRADAEAVLRDLDAQLEQYNFVAVSDILELSGIVPTSTDFKYGWTNLKSAEVIHTADGYMLRMPRPVPLD